MSLSQRTRFIALAACLVLLAALPPMRQVLEQRMLTHMMLQLPALLLAGALIGMATPHPTQIDRWNAAGLPALFAASLILTFWMLPISIDHAVASGAWDAAKAVSLVSAGVLLALFWPGAPTVVQAFVGGNLAWMGIAVGQLSQDDGPRLCNAYLLEDQAATGIGLTWLAIATSALCVAQLASPHSSFLRPIEQLFGERVDEE